MQAPKNAEYLANNSLTLVRVVLSRRPTLRVGVRVTKVCYTQISRDFLAADIFLQKRYSIYSFLSVGLSVRMMFSVSSCAVRAPSLLHV